jgi:hypothetical protein
VKGSAESLGLQTQCPVTLCNELSATRIELGAALHPVHLEERGRLSANSLF